MEDIKFKIYKKLKNKMKNILLVLLVSLGLQTQAQTLCDVGVYTTGSQFQMEVVIGVTGNSLPMMAPIYVVTYGGSSMPWNIGNQPMLAEDSCFSGPCTHMVFNYNPAGNPYDTLMTCIFYELTDSVGNIDTLMCCDDWVWDGSSFWFKLMAQPTGIEQIIKNQLINNKMYDIYGREILKPKGIYIQNRKLKYVR